MTEIVALLQTIAPLIQKTTLRQLSQVVFGMLVASGRITMLGLSRWTEKGGSYRTIQRFYHTILPWNAIQWLFFRHRFLQPADEYFIAGDIEFHFRDAKQNWGLEDFTNVKETAVTNAANLAFFMVNVSQALLRPFRQNQPDFSILDLKSYYQGCHYARETIKMLPQKPDANLFARIFEQNAHLGTIHPFSQPIPNP